MLASLFADAPAGITLEELRRRGWMKIDLGLTSYTLRIGFRVTLQFSAAIEIAISTEGVGARVNARVAVR